MFWSKLGGTGGLLHRNKEYFTFFGLYTASASPPPNPHAYTQLKKENYTRSERKEGVTQPEDNCKRKCNAKELPSHSMEIQREVKWQETTRVVFLSVVPAVTVPGVFTGRLVLPLLRENKSSVQMMKRTAPPVFTLRNCAEFALAEIFSLNFLHRAFGENGNFLSTLSLILLKILVML